MRPCDHDKTIRAELNDWGLKGVNTSAKIAPEAGKVEKRRKRDQGVGLLFPRVGRMQGKEHKLDLCQGALVEVNHQIHLTCLNWGRLNTSAP